MTDCAAPRHAGDEQGTQTAEGSRLCHPCLARMRADLRRLPSLHATLATLSDPRRGLTLTGAGDGLPFHEAAAECASQIRHDTWTLTRWTLDAGRAQSCPVPVIAAVCAWLHGWTPWIATRDWAPHAAGALAADRGRALALLDPMPCAVITIPPPLNWCPRCGRTGHLTAVVWQNPADRRPCTVGCAGCGHDWAATEWMRLGHDIIRHATAQAA